MLLDKMVSSYRKNYGKVLALLKKARSKQDTFRDKIRIDPLETKLLNQFMIFENSLFDKLNFLYKYEHKSNGNLSKEKKEKLELKLQGIRESLTIVTQIHNVLSYTYWKEVPQKAWNLFILGIRYTPCPTKVTDLQASNFFETLTRYHMENSNFSILPDTEKANSYSDKPLNDKEFLGLD